MRSESTQPRDNHDKDCDGSIHSKSKQNAKSKRRRPKRNRNGSKRIIYNDNPRPSKSMNEIGRIVSKYNLRQISTQKLYHFKTRVGVYRYIEQLFKSQTVDSIKDYSKLKQRLNGKSEDVVQPSSIQRFRSAITQFTIT